MDKPTSKKFPGEASNQSSLSAATVGENQLWLLFLAGDVSAFETIMTDYFRVLFRYGSRFSRDKEFIKDCIQDLFLYLWEHRAALRAEVAIKPYLMVSLRRLMHRNLPDAFFIDEFTEDKVKPFELMFSVEEQYIHQETLVHRIQEMKQLLERLPNRQKEVIYLKFFQELDRDQIAEVMDIAPQTVSNLIQLAFKCLRTNIKLARLPLLLVSGEIIQAIIDIILNNLPGK